MNKEGTFYNGRLNLAKYLFDGDEEKASKLLLLIESFSSSSTPPEFKNLVMVLAEDSCKWCKDGECLFYMPDSLFHCDGKCENFEEKLENCTYL